MTKRYIFENSPIAGQNSIHSTRLTVSTLQNVRLIKITLEVECEDESVQAVVVGLHSKESRGRKEYYMLPLIKKEL